MPCSTQRLRVLLGALDLVAASAFFAPGCATALQFEPCTPTGQSSGADPAEQAALAWERKSCDAENAIYSTWGPKLTRLETLQGELKTASDAGNWDTYREKWAAALPLLKELQAAALANSQATGAAQVTSLYGADVGYFIQNAGLGTAASLDDAAAKIVAGLNGNNAGLAGGAGMLLIGQSVTRGTEFVRGLAQTAKTDTQKAKTAEATAKGEQRRDMLEGRTTEGYISGFGERIRSVWKPWLLMLMVVCFGGAWLGAKRGQNGFVAGVAAGLAYLLPGVVMAIAFIVVPFVPAWVMIGATIAGTIGVYYFAGPVFNSLAAIVGGSNTATGRRIRIIGGVIDELRGGSSTPAGGVVGDMAADKATHGSARWGTVEEMRKGGHLLPPGTPAGFALAKVDATPAGLDRRFRFVGHVVTVAPTGSGKGIGAVIPNLLEYPGSCLVLDIKGENVAVTARARRELGQKVFVVDPFEIASGPRHAFNLLDRLDTSNPECVSESAALAEALVVVDAKGGGDSAHFDESAKTFLQGLMLYVVGLDDRAKRNLGELRRLLTGSEETLQEMLAEMAADDAAAFGLPARAANTLIGMADRERGSVLSTARRNTAFLDDPRIAAALSRSDFNLANIKAEAMTVYLVLPANKLASNARFVRGFVGSVIAAITASPQQPAHRVAFLLDEFGQLGYMKSIEDAVSVLRGYGLSFWVFIQDLSQLKGVYPRWQTFLANSAKTFFGTDDYDTAKYISDSLGQGTIEYETETEGKNQGGSLAGSGASMNRGRSTGSSQQFTGRHLLTPDEVMRLGPERPIVITKGEHPYQLTRLNYLVDAEYSGKADANPYHS